jgi:hypothetical protein
MCTVSFLPLGESRFMLTSNRDEAPNRSPAHLTRQDNLLYPKDTLAGGTWLCAKNNSSLVCLLNGAFVKHSHQPPYRRSRGLMVLDFFDYTDANTFATTYDFEGIEPFTMVIWQKGQLWELRWDEKQVHFTSLPPDEPHFWSSSTLYPPPVQARRLGWFNNWLSSKPYFTRENVVKFHATGGDGDIENDLMMNRQNIVRTVSISNVIYTPEQGFNMNYNDLLRQQVTEEVLALS